MKLEGDVYSVKVGQDKRPNSKSFLSVAVITCASHAQGRRFEPGRKHRLLFEESASRPRVGHVCFNERAQGGNVGSYGVMVSTLDFESSDPSSNLGRT